MGLLNIINGFSQSCLPYGIFFATQAQIDSFQVNYPNCYEIEGDVIINDSFTGNITNLFGLSEIRSIGGELIISTNPSLTSFAGLENLCQIENNLKIINNNALTNLVGLDNIQSVGNYIDITWNFGLIELTGFEALTAIGGGLHIGNNYVLSHLSGLENITSIGHDLTIIDNDALISLEGLSNLKTMGADIRIVDNDALVSLKGLDSINCNTIVDLTISMNDQLSICNVQSICNYLTNPNGQVDINANAPGCHNQTEILNACFNAFNKSNMMGHDYRIFLNPSSTQIVVKTPPINSQIYVFIYNMVGQKNFSQAITDQTTLINICEYKQGIYLAILNNEFTSKSFKILKK